MIYEFEIMGLSVHSKIKILGHTHTGFKYQWFYINENVHNIKDHNLNLKDV